MSALGAVLKETQILKLECAATPSVFAYVSAPLDTPHHLPPPCSQSARQQARPRRRSCSRGGPQGQLAAAIARVGRPLSNQSVCLRVSTPADTAPLLTSETHPRSLKYNALGPKGGAAIAEGLKGNSTLQSLE